MDFLREHRGEIFLLFLGMLVGMVIVQWICWVFRWGRFASAEGGEERQDSDPGGDSRPRTMRYMIVADLLVKIINDFRHLLALIVMAIFAVVIMYVLITDSDGDKSDGIQTVVASFGGIIGSIIGYYFGESAASKRVDVVVEEDDFDPSAGTREQRDPPPEEEGADGVAAAAGAEATRSQPRKPPVPKEIQKIQEQKKAGDSSSDDVETPGPKVS